MARRCRSIQELISIWANLHPMTHRKRFKHGEPRGNEKCERKISALVADASFKNLSSGSVTVVESQRSSPDRPLEWSADGRDRFEQLR